MIARVNDESFEKIESVEREVETFGELRRSTTEDAIELCAFKGKDFDAVTPLYYYDTRWHDPQTGQFLDTDPVGYEEDQLNVYRYVGTNATNRVDPSGL